MITKNKPVYYCEHCNKHGLSKGSMRKHERVCKRNPDNYHPCYGCKHFEIVTETNEQHYEGGGEIHTRDITERYAYCHLKKCQVHNRIAELKGYLEQFPKSFDGSVLMPKECADFEPVYSPQQEADTFLY